MAKDKIIREPTLSPEVEQQLKSAQSQLALYARDMQKAIAALRDSEALFHGISMVATDAVLMMDNGGRISFWNPAAERMFGYSNEEAVGQELHYLIAPECYRTAFDAGHRTFLETGTGPILNKLQELRAIHKDGTEFPVELSVSALKFNGKWHAVGIVRDTTEREKTLVLNQRLGRILDNSLNEIYVFDAQTLRFIQVNEGARRNLGYTMEELASMTPVDLKTEYTRESFEALLQPLRSGKQGQLIFETLHRRKDGSLYPVEVRLQLSHTETPPVFVTIIEDTTERKQSEQAMYRLNRALRTLSTCNEIIIRMSSETELLENICQNIVEQGGYQAVFVIYVEGDPNKTGRQVAHAGDAEGLYSNLREGGWVDDFLKQCRMGRAIRHDEVVIIKDIEREADDCAVCAEVTPGGCRTSIALSIMIDGKILGTLNIYSMEKEAFDGDEVRLLRVLTDDLAYGIKTQRERLKRESTEHELEASEVRLRTVIENEADAIVVLNHGGNVVLVNQAAERLFGRDRAQLIDTKLDNLLTADEFTELDITHADGQSVTTEIRRSETQWEGQIAHIVTLHDVTERKYLQAEQLKSAQQLQETLVDMVQAMAVAVEKRDPYTAGHQRRVAELGVAIAKEMGLEVDRTEGLLLGGIIHDVGKIYIPSEILNRPGKLSDIEFQLIKTHAQVGYDIIRGVKFPWPVAEMVYQHHERMDGSGYPQGLKGDKIILEARILAVADVVEAMTSHRPYRPALGPDQALAEIERHRGCWYDPGAADACLRLFRDKDFQWEHTASLV